MDDYQYALMLQRQIEAEANKSLQISSRDEEYAKQLQKQFEIETVPNKSMQISSKDEEYAKQLQNQFANELSTGPKGEKENKSLILNSLYYEDKRNKNKDPTKSLVDPSWEVIDPTPDVHTLFIAFDQRFFWHRLQMVAVSWSKRMTTCAGVCTYRGRGGLCTITLSEPLLKLRPRKDLVETLLHEMIHAYLFITNNNKDRDGHGPEFHKHMYRINNEAGTNITVYHDFHDEVNLYKQHVWRCDGPCQKRSPYFGLVRRAMNRAPGPNDRWWADHTRACGGNFIKVQAPEKPATKSTVKKTKEVAKPQTNTILSYMNKTTTDNTIIKPIKNPSFSQDKLPKNIMSFGDLAKNGGNTFKKPAANSTITNNSDKLPKNVVGFKDLAKGGGTQVRSNSSSTVLEKTKKGKAVNGGNDNIKPVQPIAIFNGAGHSLSTTISSSSNNSQHDYDKVRNHWANKFSNSNSSTTKINQSTSGNFVANATIKQTQLSNKDKQPIQNPGPSPGKRAQPPNENIPSEKRVKTDDVIDLTEGATVTCPICSKIFHENLIEIHVDRCVQILSESFSDDNAFSDNENSPEPDAKVPCLICDKMVNKKELNNHLEECTGIIADQSTYLEDEDSFKCPVCFKDIRDSDMNEHLNLCLPK